MFKFRNFNAAHRYDLSIENMLTKLHGIGEYISNSVINTKIDYADKTITFAVYDIESAITERFFRYLEEDPAITVRLSARRNDCRVDYTKRFHGARLISRTVSYDFGDDTVTQHKCVLRFDTSEIESFLPLDEAAP